MTDTATTASTEAPTMTNEQRCALQRLCNSYKVEFVPSSFHTRSDLPPGYFAGWVGPIYVGVCPEGRISS